MTRHEAIRKRLIRIKERQRRRRSNPNPEQVRECIEDCDALILELAKLLLQAGSENRKERKSE